MNYANIYNVVKIRLIQFRTSTTNNTVLQFDFDATKKILGKVSTIIVIELILKFRRNFQFYNKEKIKLKQKEITEMP